MSDIFACTKCGKKLNNKFDKESHEKDCHGMSINLETIQLIAREGIEGLNAKIGFTCQICGDTQVIESVEHYRLYIPEGVCDACKKDLKEIILTKRKKNGRTD